MKIYCILLQKLTISKIITNDVIFFEEMESYSDTAYSNWVGYNNSNINFIAPILH